MSQPAAEPRPELFAAVVGQDRAVRLMMAASPRPVHAYLFHGPSGSGKRTAARAMAAALLCPSGGCGACDTCRRALAGIHPDLVVVERTGASLSVEDALSVTMRAQRRPAEADRQVLVVPDVQLATSSVPVLLKTVEEPPPATIFLLLADDLPPALATIVSRCVQIPFIPVAPAVVVRWLVDRGVESGVAEVAAAASGGSLDRARLLSDDPGFAARQALWRSVPSRLDGTGAAAVLVADELLSMTDEAIGPLRQSQERELAERTDQAEMAGTRGVPGRKDIEDRHKRELRRYRTDDLRLGLATLAGVYRDRLVATVADHGSVSHGMAADRRRAAAHIEAINRTSAALKRNAQEGLLLESLMVELSGLGA